MSVIVLRPGLPEMTVIVASREIVENCFSGKKKGSKREFRESSGCPRMEETLCNYQPTNQLIALKQLRNVTQCLESPGGHARRMSNARRNTLSVGYLVPLCSVESKTLIHYGQAPVQEQFGRNLGSKRYSRYFDCYSLKIPRSLKSLKCTSAIF